MTEVSVTIRSKKTGTEFYLRGCLYRTEVQDRSRIWPRADFSRVTSKNSEEMPDNIMRLAAQTHCYSGHSCFQGMYDVHYSLEVLEVAGNCFPGEAVGFSFAICRAMANGTGIKNARADDEFSRLYDEV